jgi:hypothetical protein
VAPNPVIPISGLCRLKLKVETLHREDDGKEEGKKKREITNAMQVSFNLIIKQEE